jgi:PPOX class probable F420-dependent enzyme
MFEKHGGGAVVAAGFDRVRRAFVERARVARLATVDRHGEPHVIPVCYSFDGDHFYTPIDEKPKRTDRPLKRVRNILETGRAALVIDHYDEDWSRLAWLMVRGPAGLIGPDDARHGAAVDLLRARYPQYRAMRLETAEIIVLTPDRVTAWGALDS